MNGARVTWHLGGRDQLDFWTCKAFIDAVTASLMNCWNWLCGRRLISESVHLGATSFGCPQAAHQAFGRILYVYNSDKTSIRRFIRRTCASWVIIIWFSLNWIRQGRGEVNASADADAGTKTGSLLIIRLLFFFFWLAVVYSWHFPTQKKKFVSVWIIFGLLCCPLQFASFPSRHFFETFAFFLVDLLRMKLIPTVRSPTFSPDPFTRPSSRSSRGWADEQISFFFQK